MGLPANPVTDRFGQLICPENHNEYEVDPVGLWEVKKLYTSQSPDLEHAVLKDLKFIEKLNLLYYYIRNHYPEVALSDPVRYGYKDMVAWVLLINEDVELRESKGSIYDSSKSRSKENVIKS